MPISSMLGLVATMGIWIMILATQPCSRWVGIVWMVVGFIIYYFYRRKKRLSRTDGGKDIVES